MYATVKERKLKQKEVTKPHLTSTYQKHTMYKNKHT